MMDVIFKYFLLFLIYSFLGWLLEVIIVSINRKKMSSRGFLIGPICPIYGVASLFMTLLLRKYKEDYLLLFFMAVIICSIVEYITSYIMEKVFKTRWWDYSNNKFNLNGRICLKNCILFGILGIIVILYLNPSFFNMLNKINSNVLLFISIILLIIFIIDICISFNVICKVKVAADNIRRDCTEEINEKIKEFIKARSYLYKRLLNAFPTLRLNIKNKKKK